MKSLTLTADQFATWVYPIFGTSTATSDAEFETAMRLIKLLKDKALTEAVPPTAVEQAAKRPGVSLFEYRKLRESQATFLLQSDEYSLLFKRLKDHRMQVPAVAAEDYTNLLNSIEGAPEVKVAEVVEDRIA